MANEEKALSGSPVSPAGGSAGSLGSTSTPEGLDAEWRALEGFLRGVAAKRMRGVRREDQEDVVSETLVRVWVYRQTHEVHELRRLGSRVLRWEIGTYWERRRRLDREEAFPDGLDPAGAPDIEIEVLLRDPETLDFEILEAMRHISALCWQVFRERRRDRRSHQEVADQHGKSHAWARQTEHRCWEKVIAARDRFDAEMQERFDSILVREVFDA